MRPPPARNTSLVFHRSSGTSGGTVVSWRSLDHGGPVVVRIAGEMAAGWNLMPLYADRHDDYYFFVMSAGNSASPPAENPPLGSNDAAMLAALEAGLPSMNQQVTDSVARARNAPPPAPADPDSKRFWRVHVNPNIDTDHDGSPDWAEFEIAARGTGMLVPGVSGNAFDADTNGDGIPDGDQLDFDLDGTADGADMAPEDDSVTFPVGPVPRYALFPLPPEEEGSTSLPIQISDLGTVIYHDKYWRGGTVGQLAGGGWARGINDHDVIIGTELGESQGLAMPPSAGNVCIWPTPTAASQTLQVQEGEEGSTVNVLAYQAGDGLRISGPGAISNDGRFIAHGFVNNPPTGYQDKYGSYPTLWKIPDGSGPTSRQAAHIGIKSVAEDFVTWGYRYVEGQGSHGVVYAPNLLPTLPFEPLNVLSYPLDIGGKVIFATASDDHSTLVYTGTSWQESGLYGKAIDMSDDGKAIGRNQDAMTAPILLNGKWTGIVRTAPIPKGPSDPPPPWNDVSVELMDTSPGGWILAKRGTETSEHAVMLPINVRGTHTRTEANYVGGHFTDTKAVGVDNYSIGSYAPGDAVKDRVWIMAPQNSTGIVNLFAPLNSNAALKISAPNITFSGQNEASLAAGESTFTIQAGAASTTGQDIALDLKMGTTPSVSKPIGLKVMKNRVVKVNVYGICRKRPSQNGAFVYVTQMPTAAEITAHLNDMFQPQINVTFDVLVVNAVVPLYWDLNEDQIFNGAEEKNIYSTEQDTILDNLPAASRDADIRVIVVGSVKDDGSAVGLNHNENGESAAGLTNRTGTTARPGPTCWILGEYIGKQADRPSQLDTIAHEIGHVFVDYGHPDNMNDLGHAPLPGLENKIPERLMCSGPNSSIESRLLVKGEWDEAEKWLSTTIDTPQP